MYPDSEILFPARSIPELRNARPSQAWQALIDKLSKLPETSEEVLAFSLMMIRLNNCLTCDLIATVPALVVRNARGAPFKAIKAVMNPCLKS